MKPIEVLLRENVEPLGRCGDVVKVRPGHARNYLFPKRLAVAATPDNKKLMERRRARLDLEEQARDAAVEARVARLAGLELTTAQRADPQGHLYGSVNAAAVAELLERAGERVDERDVRLEAPIKAVGRHAVRIHVHGERFAEVAVVVEAEGGGD